MNAPSIPLEPVDTFDYVIFGATGDLTMRKLLPALYRRFAEGQVPADSRIVGTARSPLDDASYRERARKALGEHVRADELVDATVDRFLAMVHYVSLNGADPTGNWEGLKTLLASGPAPDARVRVFYLATAPDLYGDIARNVDEKGLRTDTSRIVLEKPIGTDLETARKVNEGVGRHFPENSIFRIDHYLGKEAVQNIIALRFANPMLERMWDHESIEYVQITAAETVGLEGRGGYYDGSGALRDMIQNHLLQVLTVVAMERPASLEADALRDEKVRVLTSLKPLDRTNLRANVSRGQYVAGTAGGRTVPAYREELPGETPSNTETFVALKAEIDTPRWRGVPFYLRSGKRMPEKVTEVVIQFRAGEPGLFGEARPGSRLVIRVQPNESVTLPLFVKQPGNSFGLDEVDALSRLGEPDRIRYRDSYEGLMLDAVKGSPALFVRKDETEAAWRWVTPILEGWRDDTVGPDTYEAGTWGPESARELLRQAGHAWVEDDAA
ncbi:glucose-6-phosphate 1-dehydrogenase [Luteibacter sp. UNCMF331Sha3.1]|uniref:glucose-6-phosphate dehydrogenase n=1 Tax=Luteibacter sp. UNCMF331Sha3.1 TaxID=1502760 RepID=UPI0008B4F5BA|nr:glucose-6-phosphate dehydrogenase [Luteibacter sp. UNCMF331Sha3.1]SEN16330.1 glucose-6-phosphate 1-dehydrogenase [Luteibacter sp. UNCMF331Sha3.1]